MIIRPVFIELNGVIVFFVFVLLFWVFVVY